MSGGGLLYAAGIAPGTTSALAVIGVHERTIYRDYPGKINYFQTWEFDGNFSRQAIDIMRTMAPYFPLGIALQSFDGNGYKTNGDLSPVMVGARIQFCIDTHYVLFPLFYQTQAHALDTVSDVNLALLGLLKSKSPQVKDATRHALTFIRRAKFAYLNGDRDLVHKAWGPEPSHNIRDKVSARTGIKRRVRTLSLRGRTYERRSSNGRRTFLRNRIREHAPVMDQDKRRRTSRPRRHDGPRTSQLGGRRVQHQGGRPPAHDL